MAKALMLRTCNADMTSYGEFEAAFRAERAVRG